MTTSLVWIDLVSFWKHKEKRKILVYAKVPGFFFNETVEIDVEQTCRVLIFIPTTILNQLRLDSEKSSLNRKFLQQKISKQHQYALHPCVVVREYFEETWCRSQDHFSSVKMLAQIYEHKFASLMFTDFSHQKNTLIEKWFSKTQKMILLE